MFENILFSDVELILKINIIIYIYLFFKKKQICVEAAQGTTTTIIMVNYGYVFI